MLGNTQYWASTFAPDLKIWSVGNERLLTGWLELRNCVDEQTLLVERNVRQVVIKRTKVVTTANLEVVSNVAVNRRECSEPNGAFARVADVALPHRAAFEQSVPILDNVPVNTSHQQMDVRAVPVGTGSAGCDFTDLHTVFRANIEVLRDLEDRVRLTNQRALTVVGHAAAGFFGRFGLSPGWQVIECRGANQGV